jgi:hypothetical protein
MATNEVREAYPYAEGCNSAPIPTLLIRKKRKQDRFFPGTSRERHSPVDILILVW